MISVVTITHNNHLELLRTIESVAGIPEIQSCIVNGGSSVETATYLSAQSKHAYVSEPDEGISDAFNKGIGLAKGDYIAFLNSGDTYIGESYYNDAADMLDNNTAIEFVHSNILLRNRHGDALMKPLIRNLGAGLPALHPTMVIRKSVFDRIGFFSKDLKIAMDFDLVCRMTKAKMTGHYLDGEPVVLMDGNGISVTQARKAIAEAHKSLASQDLLTARNRFGLLSRIAFLNLGRLLSALGLDSLRFLIKRIVASRLA